MVTRVSARDYTVFEICPKFSVLPSSLKQAHITISVWGLDTYNNDLDMAIWQSTLIKTIAQRL